MGDLRKLHELCKNTKIYQAIEDESPLERRTGFADPGHTRWATYRRMFKSVLKQRTFLEQILRSNEGDRLYQWQSYVGDGEKAIIRDWTKWEEFTRCKETLDALCVATKLFEGPVRVFLYDKIFCRITDKNSTFLAIPLYMFSLGHSSKTCTEEWR